jgi:hypothetical protein
VEVVLMGVGVVFGNFVFDCVGVFDHEMFDG